MNTLAWEHFYRLDYAADDVQVRMARAEGAATTPASDAVTVIYQVNDSYRFRAYGDPATLASADWLCAQATQAFDAACALTPLDIAQALGLERTKLPAAMLACDALAACARS